VTSHRRRLPVFVAALGVGIGTLAPLTAATPAVAGDVTAPIEVTTTADVVDAGDEQTSLREAFDQANANPGDDTIVLATDPAGGLFGVAECGGPDAIDDDNGYGDFDHTDLTGALTIEGGGNVISAGCERAIESRSTGLLTLRDLTIQDSGNASPHPDDTDGGGVSAAGDVFGERLVLRRNQAPGVSGTCYCWGAGGGLYAAGAVELHDSKVVANGTFGCCVGVGGGIAAGSVHLFDTVVRNNRANNGGGVVAGEVIIESSTFRANVATRSANPAHYCCGYGGGVRATTIVIKGSTFEANSAAAGGAIFGRGPGAVVVKDSRLVGNSAFSAGGAVYAQPLGSRSPSDALIARSTVARNRVTYGEGGGVAANDITVRSSTVNGNVAGAGGGLASGAYGGGGHVTVTDSTVTGNRAVGASPGGEEAGGGVLSVNGRVDLVRATVVANRGRVGANIAGDQGLVARASVIGLAQDGPSCALHGVRTSRGFNVTDTTGNCGVAYGPTDRRAVPDLGLGPLADNGGPTLTRLPSPEGLSIIGLASCPTLPDQRGEPRPQGPRCEAGSVEIP
jgi:hypothetical protein